MWTARTTVAQKEVRREGGEPGGQRGWKQGANARIKGIFSKVADEVRKPIFGMLEHPPPLGILACPSF